MRVHGGPATGTPLDFFVSYTAADQHWARWIGDTLERAGYGVGMQATDILPGDNFLSEMSRLLDTASGLLAVASPSYFNSRYATMEWTAALAKEVARPLLVARVRDVAVPALLRTNVYIDLFGIAEDEARTRLLAAAERQPDVDDTDVSFPGTSGPEAPVFPLLAQEEGSTRAVDAQRAASAAEAQLRRGSTHRRVSGLPVSAAVDIFRDRDDVRLEISRRLAEPNQRLLVVVGPPGIGESVVVAKVLHDIENDGWPAGIDGQQVNGIVNISAMTGSKRIDVDRIVRGCAQVLGGEEENRLSSVWSQAGRPMDERIGEIVDAFSTGLVLVLLDSFEVVLGEDGRISDPALQSFFDVVLLQDCAVRLLLTSRVPLVLGPEFQRHNRRLVLEGGLPEQDGAALLRQLDVNGDARLREATNDVLVDAVRAVRGIPRGLELLVDRLATSGEHVDAAIGALDDSDDSLAELVRDSYANLDDDATLVTETLAAFGCPVTRGAIGFVVQPFLPGIDAGPVVDRLLRTHVVSALAATGTVTLHPLSMEVALNVLGAREPERREQLDLRIADWYRTVSRPEIEWHDVEDVSPQQLEFRHRLRAGDVNGAADVLCTIDDFLILRGFTGRVAGMHAQVAGRITDDAVRVRHLVGLGIVRMIGGPVFEAPAILREARDLAVEVGDPLSEGQALHWLGDWERQQRDLETAISTLTRANELLCEFGTQREVLHALQALALAHIYAGDVEAGLSVCDRISQSATQGANIEGLARADDTRSLAFLVSGRFDESIAAVDRAVDLYDEAGVPESLPYLRNVQGLVRLAQGDHAGALASFAAGHREAINIGSPRPSGMCLFNIAIAKWTAGEMGAAAAAAERAVVTLERLGGADLDAAQALERACRWRINGDEARAAEAITETAMYVRGNPTLAPPPGGDSSQ